MRSWVTSQSSSGGDPLAVIAKRSYQIVPGRPAEPLRLRCDLDDDEDLAARRCVTDTLLVGSAYARRGGTMIETAVEIGDLEMRVHGNRRFVLEGAGRLALTPAERFESLPIAWERAYGGRDRYAEARFGRDEVPPALEKMARSDGSTSPIVYPRNAVGIGFFIDVDRERLEGVAVPNLEDPTDPMTPERMLAKDPLDWLDRPVAAAYAPIDALTWPRAVFLLPHDRRPPGRPVHEIATGALLPSDLVDRDLLGPPDPRLYNRAPAGLARKTLLGGEHVRLQNLLAIMRCSSSTCPTMSRS